MTVKCPNCEWSAEVPDEKIPAGGGKGTCPKCQTKFEVHKDAKPLIEEPPVLSSPTQRDTRACPLCGEEILSVAKKCKHCQSMIDDAKEETQPHNPTKPIKDANLESCSGTMLWDSEDDTFICVKCPKCSKESKIRRGVVLKTGTDSYSVKGNGTCSCGFTFDNISRRNHYVGGICTDCGETLDNDRDFCAKCGVLQVRSVATVGPEKASRSFNPKVIFIALIGVVILLVALNLFNSSQGRHKEVTATYEGTVLDAQISGLETGVVTTKGTFTVEEINAYVQRGQEAYFNEATGQLTVGRLTYKARRGLI
jgi:predicted Zn finger-like uncharacterized protein